MNVDFTREPIIETIITPKEGCKLVIRSSKGAGQEEYFVDSVEVIAFGCAFFFRSVERPKAFLVPVSDYEVLEVRETRMTLKNTGIDRSIKIGGGKESSAKSNREVDKAEEMLEGTKEEVNLSSDEATPGEISEPRSENRTDKKRDRRRQYRKRKGREEGEKNDSKAEEILKDQTLPTSETQETPVTSTTHFSSLLQPPSTLISETLVNYRKNELFKDVFYLTEEEQYKPHDKVHELLNEEEFKISQPQELNEEKTDDSQTFDSQAEQSGTSLDPFENMMINSQEELQNIKKNEDLLLKDAMKIEESSPLQKEELKSTEEASLD